MRQDCKNRDKKQFKRKEFRQKVEEDESLKEDLFYLSFHYDNSLKSFQYQSVAHQAPLSVEFSRQEYWSGCHSLLQGIFLTQGLNPGLLLCRKMVYHLSHQGSPKICITCMCACMLSHFSYVQLFATPWAIAHQAPLSMGILQARILEWLPFPSPGDLPDPGIEPGCPALEADALTSEPPGKPQIIC